MFEDRGTVLRAGIATLLLCVAAVSALSNVKASDERRAGIIRAVPNAIAYAHRAVADLNQARRP